MTADLAAGLRALAVSLPPSTPVPVPAGALLELLDVAVEVTTTPPADPTVEEISARYGRAPSTIRGWCEAGRFPGAYKLGREWRIPAAGIAAFEAGLRGRTTANRPCMQSLGDWRHASWNSL